MKRLGFSNPQDGRKSPGDAFESIIGAKKKEDSVSLDNWFQTYYMRLLIYIADACRCGVVPFKVMNYSREYLFTVLLHPRGRLLSLDHFLL